MQRKFRVVKKKIQGRIEEISSKEGNFFAFTVSVVFCLFFFSFPIACLSRYFVSYLIVFSNIQKKLSLFFMPNFFITTHATVFFFFGKYIIGIKRGSVEWWARCRLGGWKSECSQPLTAFASIRITHVDSSFLYSILLLFLFKYCIL